jgi:hypothetical protein
MCVPASPRAGQRGNGPTDGAHTGEDDMAEDLQKGDHVTWKSHGGEAEGTVQKKITKDTEAAGRKVRASSDDPQYEVRSDKSGGTAVHKPSALSKEKK